MKTTYLIDLAREALASYGDLDVAIEIRDHGAVEVLNPTTTFIDHGDKPNDPKIFLISAIIED